MGVRCCTQLKVPLGRTKARTVARKQQNRIATVGADLDRIIAISTSDNGGIVIVVVAVVVVETALGVSSVELPPKNNEFFFRTNSSNIGLRLCHLWSTYFNLKYEASSE